MLPVQSRGGAGWWGGTSGPELLDTDVRGSRIVQRCTSIVGAAANSKIQLVWDVLVLIEHAHCIASPQGGNKKALALYAVQMETLLASAKRQQAAYRSEYDSLERSLANVDGPVSFGSLEAQRKWGVTRDEILRKVEDANKTAEQFLETVRSIIEDTLKARARRN